jgi:uncharacterized phage-associated protein
MSTIGKLLSDLWNRYILSLGIREGTVGTIEFKFQEDKAVEVVLYLARRAKNPDLHSIGKLMYTADKLSLERYGRFICGDDYFAMEWGPVPSRTYDLLKAARQQGLPFRVEGRAVVAQRDADTDELSESDIECLDAALEIIGNSGFGARHQKTSDSAYEKAWKNRGISNSARMDIEDIAQLLAHSEELIEYLTHRE